MSRLPGINRVWDDFLGNAERQPENYPILPPVNDPELGTASSGGIDFGTTYQEHDPFYRMSAAVTGRTPQQLAEQYLAPMGFATGQGTGARPQPAPSEDPVEREIQGILGAVGIHYAPPPEPTAGPTQRQQAGKLGETRPPADIGAQEAARPDTESSAITRLLAALAPHVPGMEEYGRQVDEAVTEGRSIPMPSTASIEEAVNIFSNPATFGGRVGASVLEASRTVPRRVVTAAGETYQHTPFDTPRRAIDMAEELSRAGRSVTEVTDTVNEFLARNDVTHELGSVRQAANGQWLFELSDHNARLIGDAENLFGAFRRGRVLENAPLSETLSHPRLFDTWPELGNLRMNVTRVRERAGRRGNFDPVTGEINIWASKPEDMMNTLFHEIDHAVQFLEGRLPSGTTDFVRASSLESILTHSPAFAETFIQGLPRWLGRNLEREIVDLFNQRYPTSSGQPIRFNDIGDVQRYIKQTHGTFAGGIPNAVLRSLTEDLNFRIYHRLDTEIEARAAGTRWDWNPRMRRAVDPDLSDLEGPSVPPGRRYDRPPFPIYTREQAPWGGGGEPPAAPVTPSQSVTPDAPAGRRSLAVNRELLNQIPSTAGIPTQYVETYLSNVAPETMQRIHNRIIEEIGSTRLASLGWTAEHVRSLSNRLKAEFGIRLRPDLLRAYVRSIHQERLGRSAVQAGFRTRELD